MSNGIRCKTCGKTLETNLSLCDHGASIPHVPSNYYATTPPALRPLRVGPGVPAPEVEEWGSGVLRERRLGRELGRDE